MIPQIIAHLNDVSVAPEPATAPGVDVRSFADALHVLVLAAGSLDLSDTKQKDARELVRTLTGADRIRKTAIADALAHLEGDARLVVEGTTVSLRSATSTPDAEPPKAEPPKAEPPKAEPPKAEPPKAGPPKAEPPKAEPTPDAEPTKAEPTPDAEDMTLSVPAPQRIALVDAIPAGELYVTWGEILAQAEQAYREAEVYKTHKDLSPEWRFSAYNSGERYIVDIIVRVVLPELACMFAVDGGSSVGRSLIPFLEADPDCLVIRGIR